MKFLTSNLQSSVVIMSHVQVRGHSIQARATHTATAITHTPGLVEVVIFGGYSEWPKDYKTDADLKPISHTVVLLFGESTSCACVPR